MFGNTNKNKKIQTKKNPNSKQMNFDGFTFEPPPQIQKYTLPVEAAKLIGCKAELAAGPIVKKPPPVFNISEPLTPDHKPILWFPDYSYQHDIFTGVPILWPQESLGRTTAIFDPITGDRIFWLPDSSPSTHPIHHLLAFNNGLSDISVAIIGALPIRTLSALARTCNYYYRIITPCMRGGIPAIHAKNVKRFTSLWMFDAMIDTNIGETTPLAVLQSIPMLKTIFGPYTDTNGKPCWDIYNQEALDTWTVIFRVPIYILYF
jgi:hypothetical protein